MKCFFLSSLICSFCFFSVMAIKEVPVPIKIYPQGAPQSNDIADSERFDGFCVDNITDPEIIVFSPPQHKNTGVAMLICPGGAYIREAVVHEGYEVGEWLASEGITGIVLKYRLPNKHKEIPLLDVQTAMNWIHQKSDSLHIHPDKIGVSGFSAGGHLAAMSGTRLRGIERPDFMVLFYPVISMTDSLTHKGSRSNLLGHLFTETDIYDYSAEKQVTQNTPPTLLLLSDDDVVVTPLNSIVFYQALKANKVKSSLCIFPVGGHGWGYNKEFDYHDDWKSLLIRWLRDNRIL